MEGKGLLLQLVKLVTDSSSLQVGFKIFFIFCATKKFMRFIYQAVCGIDCSQAFSMNKKETPQDLTRKDGPTIRSLIFKTKTKKKNGTSAAIWTTNNYEFSTTLLPNDLPFQWRRIGQPIELLERSDPQSPTAARRHWYRRVDVGLFNGP